MSGGEEKNILIFDFGGGTLDITILKIGGEERYQIMAKTGDDRLGG